MRSSGLWQIWIGTLALLALIGGLGWYWQTEDQRLQAAQQAVLQRQLDEAMTLYAENCAVCHGASGEGLGATPALNREDLRHADPDSLHKIISRGLYNTAMPAWSIAEGGSLSDYQITELVNLILYGDWQSVADRVAQLGIMPAQPKVSQPNPEVLQGVAALPEGDLLRLGVEVYAQQCVACHGPDGQGTNLAPALNDPSVRSQPPEVLERTIRYGVNGTLMSAWEGVLSDEEIAAVIALITRWDEIPTGAIPAPPTPTPLAVDETILALGEQLYAQNCALCHGSNGQGTRRAPALNVKSYLESTNDAALQQIIAQGVPGTAMPAWGARLSDQEIQAIVAFIRSWEPTAPEVAVPEQTGGGPWWALGGSESPAQGGPWMGRGRGRGRRWGGSSAIPGTPAVPLLPGFTPTPTATPTLSPTASPTATTPPTEMAEVTSPPLPATPTARPQAGGPHPQHPGGGATLGWSLMSESTWYGLLLLGSVMLLGGLLTLIGFWGAWEVR